MKQEQFELMFPLMVIAMMLWGYYEPSGPKEKKDASFLNENLQMPDNQTQTSLTPRQKEWAEKAVKRYAATQEKKWRNWNQSMFEPD